jgi:galactose mutarotase-like enzyme
MSSTSELPGTRALPERVTWHGAEALRLASSELSVVVLPGHGAKIASVLQLSAGREWLAQPAGDLPAPRYGASFVDAEMCGWDELLPTIDACVSPETGAALPDHGEVWALPWRIEDEGPDRLTTSVEGIALPYRLRRTLVAAGPSLRIAYELSAASRLSLLWAAHPQFAARPGTTVHLAAGEVIETYPGPVATVPWSPAAVTDLPRGTSRKLYVTPEVRAGSAELRDPDGTSLRLAWDVPYVGIWLDHAQFAREPVVAIEPTTGFYDALDRASAAGRVSVVEPGRPLEWTLELTVGMHA